MARENGSNPRGRTMNGFQLSGELLLLREQIRRVVQEEIVPLELTLDPDAPDMPREDWLRISQKTRAAGLGYLYLEPAR